MLVKHPQMIRGLAVCIGLLILLSGATPVQAGPGRGKLASGAFPKRERKSSEVAIPVETEPPTTTSTTTTVTPVTAAPTTTSSTTTRAPAPATTSTTAPPPTTTAPPPPPTTTAPPVSSGSSMPVGDLPGWRQVFTDDFNTSVPVGGFGAVYGSRWAMYGDGWKDTAAKSEGTPSRYYPSRVLSVHDGVLDKYLHTEDGINMVAAVAPKMGAQVYGRYSVRFRADAAAGYKIAWLLWPQSQVFPRDGEIDFPEGNLDENMWAFMHRLGASSTSDQDAFAINAAFTSWHTATIEWSPSKIVFLLDDNVVGTSTNRIPNTPMDWILQSETCIGGCQPASSTSAHVQIDWVAAYSYNP
jgi:hypothetical protein